MKKLSGGVLAGYLSGARCRLAYDPVDATATATATSCLLLQFNPDSFSLLVPAHPGSQNKGLLNECMYVCM